MTTKGKGEIRPKRETVCSEAQAWGRVGKKRSVARREKWSRIVCRGLRRLDADYEHD